MTKYVNANLVPDQYVIHEEGGERFIFAQPAGERYVIRERLSLKIISVVVLAATISATGLFSWVVHVAHH